MGEGRGRLLDRDTKNAGEGDGGWLLFVPGGQGLSMNPSAAVNVPLRGWLCPVIKGCLGDASSPGPGGIRSLLLCGDHDGPLKLAAPEGAVGSRSPPLLHPTSSPSGPQRGAPPSRGSLCCEVRQDT